MQMTLGWSVLYILMSHCVLEYLKLKIEQINREKIVYSERIIVECSPAYISHRELALAVLGMWTLGKECEHLSFE